MIKNPPKTNDGPAIPSLNGWRHPRTNELLKAGRFTQAEIDEYMGTAPAPKPKPKSKPAADPTIEPKSVHEMTKLELEALGRQHGVELDRRHSKQDLIEELEALGIA